MKPIKHVLIRNLKILVIAALASLLVPRAAIADEITICSFNVYKLGAVDEKYESLDPDGDEEIPLRVQNLADVLAVEDLDLISLQEVYAGERGHAVIRDLVQALDTFYGIRYRYILSEHIGRGLIPESIAFLYRPETIRPEAVTSRGSYSDLIAIPGRDLVRTRWVAGDFDFTLIAAHLAWGNESDRDAGYLKIADILENHTDYSDDSDVIVMGDFNRFGKGFNSIDHLDYQAGDFFVPNVQFFDPDVHTVKAVTQASIQGTGVPGNDPQRLSTTVAGNRYVYDMVMFTPDAAEEYTAGTTPGTLGQDFGILYFDEYGWPGHQPGTESLSHNRLKEAYSDHRPLYVRFRTDTGTSDRDPIELRPETPMFFGTSGGNRFHLKSCWTIRDRTLSETWDSVHEAEADRRPCGVCKPTD